jgi:opacity protein-like surface antigen
MWMRAVRNGVLISSLLGCLMGCLGSSAHAAEQRLGIQPSGNEHYDFDPETYPRIYAGVGFGRAYESGEFANSSDRSLYKIFIGANYSKYLGTELMFLKMDEASGSPGNYFIQLNNYSWSVAGVATLPLSDNFEVGLKLGYASNNVQVSSTSTASGTTRSGWTYGVFTTVNVTSHIALRAEFEGTDFGSYAFTVAALSGIYKF